MHRIKHDAPTLDVEHTNASGWESTVKISALKKGVNKVFSSQFWFLWILETWIMPDELYGANLCLFSVLLTF